MGFDKCRRDAEPPFGRAYVHIGIDFLYPALALASCVVGSPAKGTVTTLDTSLRSSWSVYSGISHSELSSLNRGAGKTNDFTHGI